MIHWPYFQGEYEEAMGIFDSELHPRTKKSGSNFNMSDCSSLLKRIEMEGKKKKINKRELPI